METDKEDKTNNNNNNNHDPKNAQTLKPVFSGQETINTNSQSIKISSVPSSGMIPMETNVTQQPMLNRKTIVWIYTEDVASVIVPFMIKVATDLPQYNIIPLSNKLDVFRLFEVYKDIPFIIFPGTGGEWLISLIRSTFLHFKSTIPPPQLIVFASITDPKWKDTLLSSGTKIILDRIDLLVSHISSLSGPSLLMIPNFTFQSTNSPTSSFGRTSLHLGGGGGGVGSSSQISNMVKWPKVGEVIVGSQSNNNNNNMSYQLTELLGEGGYGYVFRCVDAYRQRFVCKILKNFKAKSETEFDWAKEILFLKNLNHPNIIRFYDAFEYQGLYYMILEEADDSLRSYMSKLNKPLTQIQIIKIVGQILSALHHIHACKIIHRDLHLDNILCTKKPVVVVKEEQEEEQEQEEEIVIKITDFGISKNMTGQHHHDGGLVAFTKIGRDYDVSPELISRGYTTTQSDIYQLGLLIYFLVTGKNAVGPEDGPPATAVVTGVARWRAEQLGGSLGPIISKMLRRHEEWRYKTTMEVWSELKGCLDQDQKKVEKK